MYTRSRVMKVFGVNVYGGWNDGVAVMRWNAGGPREAQGASAGSQSVQNVIFVVLIEDSRKHGISSSIVFA